MYSFRKSLIALVGLSLLAGALGAVPALAGAAQKDKGPRQFYLTQTTHDGSQAPTACAEGYHMASLWEIFDTSNLKYNTALGHTTGDSGSGPPAISGGWIRTGGSGLTTIGTGAASCRGFTVAHSNETGTLAFLTTGIPPARDESARGMPLRFHAAVPSRSGACKTEGAEADAHPEQRHVAPAPGRKRRGHPA